MPKRTCLVMRPAFGIPLAALAVFTLPGAPTRAATACHAAPNAAASPGEHWYYRTDRATKRQCWYLAAQGRGTVRAAPVEDAPAQTGSKRSSVTAANDQGTPEMSVQDRVQRLIFGTAQPVAADANAAPATAYAAPPPQGHRIVRTAPVAETPAERKPARSVSKRSSVTTTSDQDVEEMSTRDRVQRSIIATPPPVDADANAASAMAYATPPPPAVPPPWPASAQPVDTFDGVRLAMSASAAAAPPARDAWTDGATADASSEPAFPAPTVTHVVARADAAVTPVQIAVAALAIAGALLYAAVELALVRRRRVRVES